MRATRVKGVVVAYPCVQEVIVLILGEMGIDGDQFVAIFLFYCYF